MSAPDDDEAFQREMYRLALAELARILQDPSSTNQDRLQAASYIRRAAGGDTPAPPTDADREAAWPLFLAWRESCGSTYQTLALKGVAFAAFLAGRASVKP